MRTRKLWITPAILAGVLIALISLIYIGSVVNPTAHLKGLPVELVNEDAGVATTAGEVNLGAQVMAGLEKSSGVTSRLKLRATNLPTAEHQMNTGHADAVILIPATFSADVLALYGQATSSTSVPTIDVLTNQRNGGVATSLASGVAQPALDAASKSLASTLTSQSPTTTNATLTALRANPVTVTVTSYHPLPDHSALGLSAFYIALLTLMCGFLGGTITNSSVDSGIGFAPTELGPKWRLRQPVPITRRQTLLTKWAIVTVLAPLLAGLMLLIAVAALHVYAPNVLLLWVFTSFAAIVVGLGTLVLFATFGSLGQLLGMILFLYLSLASSGGTIPLEALPGFLRFMANIEPLRQILGGVRSIMYYNAVADAGLTRGLIMTAIGLVFWLVAGLIVTAFYDRRGLHRISPELLAYVNRSVAQYNGTRADTAAESTASA